MIIRIAKPVDFLALSQLAAIRGPGEKNYFNRCHDENRVILMSGNEESPLGFVMLNPRSRYQPFRSAGIPEIQDLFVHPDARRQGIGEALVLTCGEHALQSGATMAGMAVGLHAGFGAAQRLYARLGYAPDGFGLVYDMQPVIPGETRPVDDDLCLMLVKELLSKLD